MDRTHPKRQGLVLRDKCHGTVLPSPRPGGTPNRDQNRDVFAAEQLSRLRRARLRESRRRWIVDAGATDAKTPMWVSAQNWLADIQAWSTTPAGQEALVRNKTRAAMLSRVAAALAAHADHRSGRHCAASNATVAAAAGCSPRTVTTVRALLREAGVAVEIRRGTGSSATHAYGRRASIWHLISRPGPVDNRRDCDLPPSLCDRRLSHLQELSPRGRKRPGHAQHRKGLHPNTAQPRPLALQRLAAGIIAGSRGLGRVHPGHVCDALTRAGLDVSSWTPRQVLDALNADMRARGSYWPDEIHNPAGFLVGRLRRLPASPPVNAAGDTSSEPGGDRQNLPIPASRRTRAAAMEFFAAHQRRIRQARSVAPRSPMISSRGNKVTGERPPC